MHYLLNLLEATHYFIFSDGFYTIESSTHSAIPSVIEEMKNCYLLPKKDDVVIDVGANYGFYSLLSSRLIGDGGLILALEPESTNYAVLVANLMVNNIKNTKALKIGLSDNENNEICLYLSSHPGQHSLVFQRTSDFEFIAVRTLDNLIEELDVKKVNLIKIDAEGAEIPILKGALKTITRYKPALTIASYHYLNEAIEVRDFIKNNSDFYDIKSTFNPGEGIILQAQPR